jgi:sulfur carrier protein ThiS
MTTRKYSSRSQQTTLTAGITSTATSATVVSGSSLLGGITISAGETFTVVIDPDTALEEIVDVTAVSTNTLTIVRAIDTSPATGQAHSAGAVVRHMAIGRDYREANSHIENVTTAHGLTIANVLETTDTNIITSAMIVDGAIVNADINASAAIADTKLATISTAGKVSNSATTAASANTASAIVARDASGNFTAGTITANLTGNVTGNVTGTVSGNAGTVTNGIYTTDTGTVTSTMILDGTILNADINASAAIDKTKISGTAITAGDTGTVTSTMILDGTILNADINASAAIDKTKISGTAVTAADTGTVTSTMIANDTIVNADINSAAAIAYSKLNLAGSITSADITNDTIVNADINTAAGIAYSKLSLGGTITSADLVDGTIVNSDINASAGIALSKLATDPLARANHTGTQTASTVSDFDTQVRTSKVTDLAAPTGSFSMNSQKIVSLGTPTANADAATKLYVDTKVSDLVNSAPGTLDTLGEIATAIQAGGTVFDAMVLKAGSTMTGALVLNADPSVNLGAATKQYVDAVAGSATAAAASASAAATTYDNFDDRYLGAKSTAPSVDNDGNALLTGALYWNSVSNTMFAWSGSAWGSISSTAAIYRYRYTASGGETSKSGTDDNGLTLSYLAGYEQVYLNGVLLARTSDYTATNGTSITSLAALASGDILEIITFTAFDLATAIPNTVMDAKGDLIVGTAADTVGKITVGTNGQYLQADSSTATGLTWSTVTGYSAPTLGSTSIASGATVTTIAGLTLTSPTLTTPALGTPSAVVLTSGTGLPLTTGITGTLPVANGGTGVTTSTGTGNSVLSAAPTLTGIVTASGDINLTAAGGPGSLIDELTLLLMGAL